MQLKSLEIFGFKSFAEKTKLVFDEGITGIVGPNGCGKSNIVDSIRWVLGEQRTKNLRSDKMENIIFNGTQSKRKSNFAEVSLSFDNTKNVLPTEYTSVTVTRKLYRSGDSEYLINGVACRLKDIQDLFMDTGIGSDSYAIIELKMVDEMLTNKDNERRKFFEEAAGISKYKVRKKQTLKRLQETDADLDRVEDLLFEIEKNLKSLEKQARRTQKYFELKEQYKAISSQYAFFTVRNIKDKQRQLEILQNNLQDQRTAVQSELAQRTARVQELKKELLDHEKALALSQEQLNEHIRHIQTVETDKSIKNERLKYLQQREIAIKDQMENEQRQLKRNQESLSELGVKEQELSSEQRQGQEQELQLKSHHSTLLSQQQAQQISMEESQHEQRATEQELQSLSREKEIKSVQVQSLENQLARTAEDTALRSESLDAFADKAENLRAEIASLEKQISTLEAQAISHKEELEAQEEALNGFKDAVYKTNRVLDARQNEYNLTKSLVENLEGFPESVKYLRKHAKWIKKAPLLSDILTVPESYKVAIESHLEPYLSHYVVNNREEAHQSIQLLAESAKGRANFFILDELGSYQPSNKESIVHAQSALDIVEVSDTYYNLASYLLGHVYLVSDATEMPEQVPDGIILLTQTGNISRRRYSMGGGSLGLFEGKRLGRAKNLEKLAKQMADLKARLSTEQNSLHETQQRLNSLKQINYDKQVNPLRKQLSERQRDLSVLESREREHREFLARVGQQASKLEEERNQLQVDISEIIPSLKIKEESLLQLNSQLVQLQQQKREIDQQVQAQAEAYNQAHIHLIHLNNQLGNIRKEQEEKQKQILRFEENQIQLQDELAQVVEDTESLIQSNLKDEDNIVQLYQQKKERQQLTEQYEQKVGMTKNNIGQVEEAVSAVRQKSDDILQRDQQLKEQATEIRLELNSLRERMSVEFSIELQELSEEALFDKPLEEYSLETLENKVYQLRNRIQGYGDINPMAVEAFQEMKERFDFITAQKQDLLDAKESLLSTIAEIDQTAKEKFLETFVLVREHFIRVFRTLFSENDSCDLILADPENPLESEVNIIARPKGKRPLTIKQLSGGEKTLTAVALLFSFYLIKPAPFCIFDEVDAPLDDANIDKFNRIIRQFALESQFIIVTHNKRTMASTNVMYGVTMENKGVSRVLPVNLEALNLN